MTGPHRTDLPQQRRRVVLTVEEAADALCVGRTTMYALIATGQVESVRIGRLRRIPAQALDAYLRGLRGSALPGNVGGGSKDPSYGTDSPAERDLRARSESDAGPKGARA